MTTRTIAELLSLGTYQDMSDEEIERLMSWREENARFDSEAKARQAAAMVEINEGAEIASQTSRKANEALLESFTKPIRLGIIGEDGFPVGGDER